MIKALVFDFDGTIINTETAWYLAFRDAYKEHGVELSLETYSQCIGTSLHAFNPYEYLKTHKNLPIDLDEFRVHIHGRHAALMEREQVRPGVVETLKAAKDAGLKIGLASSSPLEWVQKYLNQLQLTSYFECFRTADHVENVKPDPELYIQAIQALGVEPQEALAIEDSPNGSKAALAAGMHCIVTPNSITEFLAFDPALPQVPDLASIAFEDLISLKFPATNK
ncbi:HAD family phosphatase [Paenibacillus sp. TRM 82003]|nr:HAD family phosphatase [Paenibacillus sp. TRM 82003]